MNLPQFACAVLLAAAGVPVVHAAPQNFEGMFSGTQEVPPNTSPATGTGIGIYDAVAHTLAVDISFTGLVGPTTAAHLHCCASPGFTAGVAIAFTGFPAGASAGSYQRIFDLTIAGTFGPAFLNANGGTAAGAEAALAAALPARRTYFNIHTTTFPGGEIRADLALPDALFADGFE